MTSQEEGGEPLTDLFSDVSDLDAVRYLLADMHDDLAGTVARLRHLTDLGGELELR